MATGGFGTTADGGGWRGTVSDDKLPLPPIGVVSGVSVASGSGGADTPANGEDAAVGSCPSVFSSEEGGTITTTFAPVVVAAVIGMVPGEDGASGDAYGAVREPSLAMTCEPATVLELVECPEGSSSVSRGGGAAVGEVLSRPKRSCGAGGTPAAAAVGAASVVSFSTSCGGVGGLSPVALASAGAAVSVVGAPVAGAVLDACSTSDDGTDTTLCVGAA